MVIVGGSSTARTAAIADRLASAGSAHEKPAGEWPFRRHLHAPPPDPAAAIYTPHLHDAFPAGQTGATRLVLTQSGYQLQRLLDWLASHPRARFLAEADAGALRHAAPEAFQQRGPWSRIQLVELDGPAGEAEPFAAADPLARAFRTTDPGERLALCRRAVEAAPGDPAAHLAAGSAYMEVQDLDASQQALERALDLAGEWEAAHFELGKLFLRRDDLERASAAFAEAARLMPSFAAACSNLGATLGELGRSDAALAAFRQALAHDPQGHTILNNVGVVSRELGRLDESEAAFRKVVVLAPEFVFGHYNLGHTLFLQGRYRAALAAYLEGQRRDPERNPRQACRLAVVRLAAGDPQGAVADLRRCALGVPNDQKREMFAEAQEILWALLTDRPDLPGWKEASAVVKEELDRLATAS